MNNTKKIVNYESLVKLKLKSGFIFKKLRDPSVDMEREVTSFINAQKSNFNRTVSNNFDIETEEFQKFEFFTVDKRAKKVNDANDMIDGTPVLFRAQARVTILYLKPRSLIIFQTNYDFAITQPGCGGSGMLYQTGGTNYELEEIYFNKITTVGAVHDEDTYQVVEEGCGKGGESTFTSEFDGFVIRAGENFKVFASERNMQELKDARKMINEKISETN